MSITDDGSMRVQTLPGLREQVAERLRLAIATGRFPAGTRLIERELCEMMGVSRTSLREALRELQADGLITLQPNKGLSVSVISERTARSIYQVRATLEGLAARLFAQNATDKQMADLHKSVDRLRREVVIDLGGGLYRGQNPFLRHSSRRRRQRSGRRHAAAYSYPRLAIARRLAWQRGTGAAVDQGIAGIRFRP